jgi:hypothetical protein
VLARTFSVEGDHVSEASLATLLGELGAPRAVVAVESAASRRGDEPDYGRRFSIPLGEHRARLASGAFWGVEVSVSWGAELAPCLVRMLALFETLGAFSPIVRRLGNYPGHDALSVGVQVMGQRGDAAIAGLVRHLTEALRPLLDLGVVPYRSGNLWRDELLAFSPLTSAYFPMAERLFQALDPHETFPRRGRH